MTYSPPKYPTEIPTYLTDGDDMPPWYDDLNDWNAFKANSLRAELCSCLSALGTLPQGNFDTVKDRLNKLGSGCSLLITTNFNIAQGSDVFIPFSSTNATELIDDDSYHDMTTNPDRITIPRTGKYLISWGFYGYFSNSAADGNVCACLYINANAFGPFFWNTFKTRGAGFGISAYRNLTTSDYIHFCVYSDHDTIRTIYANLTLMSVVYMGG